MAKDEVPLEAHLDQVLMQAGIEWLMPSCKELLPGNPPGSPEAVVVRLGDRGAQALIKRLEGKTFTVSDKP
jgi:hypothetical protein